MGMASLGADAPMPSADALLGALRAGGSGGAWSSDKRDAVARLAGLSSAGLAEAALSELWTSLVKAALCDELCGARARRGFYA